MAELGDGRESNQKLKEEVSCHFPTFLKTTSGVGLGRGNIILAIMHITLPSVSNIKMFIMSVSFLWL